MSKQQSVKFTNVCDESLKYFKRTLNKVKSRPLCNLSHIFCLQGISLDQRVNGGWSQLVIYNILLL